MTDLPATKAPRARRDEQRIALATGGLLGAVLALEIIAFGVPNIIAGRTGYALIPIGTVAGALLGLTRVRHLLLAVAAALGVVLVIVAYTPAIRRPAQGLVRSDPVGERPVQAIVVLSGGISAEGHLKPAAADRLLTGLALVRRGLAGTLIVSRERSGPPARAVTSDADQQRLIALIERPVRLLVVDSIFSTRDEAVRMRALARSLDIDSVAVVTSPTHTYRACATFEKVGFSVTCVPSESRDVALRTLRLPADRVRAFQLWLYELAALVKYRMAGWI